MHHLPTEVLDLILDQTCRAGLSQVLLANRFLHTLALRILYCAPSSGSCEDEPTLSTKQQVLLLQTLARQQSLDGLSKPNDFVRSLSLHFTNNTVTPNLVRLIQSALRTLPNLVDLDLQFSVFDNYHKFSWCLTGCPFQLQRLKTSIYYDATLANFLTSQPSIAELSMSGLASNPPALLPSDALPRLNTLRNAHVQSGSLAHFITGRAVEAASLTLPWDDWQSALDVLTTGRVPLQRLTLLCLDADCAEVLFAELANRLPGLVALHAVFFMSIMSHTKLLTLGRDLGPLRHLRYVTFMGPDSGTVEEEREIVVAWSDACPSLTTIILPLGQVWHKQPNGKWHCFEDTDE